MTVLRLLVLDPSGILAWLVEHAAPVGVDVEGVTTLQEAERVVREQPPDAAVVSVPPGALPWRQFQHLCAIHRVPVLYESCVHRNAGDVGIDPADGTALFLGKPAPRGALRDALEQLLARVAIATPAQGH